MINSIRLLRALAAWLVVLHHCVQIFYGFERAGGWLVSLAKYGSIGVDLFFVISGFVIFHSMAEKEVSAVSFAVNRLVRIVPVYWFFTTLTALVLIYFPGVVQFSEYEAVFFAKSLIFWPHPNPSGIGYFPLLTVGWTLNYEMAFYAIFFIALCFPRRGVVFVLFLGVAVLSSLLYKLGGDFVFYNNSMVYEFLLGVVVCVCYRSGWIRLNDYLALAVIGASIVVIGTSSGVSHDPVRFGLPCAAILVSVLSLERFFPEKGFLLKLGDWSYSTYLCHVLVIFFVFQLSKVYDKVVFGFWVVLIVALVVPVSILSYKAIERPPLKVVKGFLVRRQDSRL